MKLHELLAVHGGLEQRLTKEVAEAQAAFAQKHLFEKRVVTFSPKNEVAGGVQDATVEEFVGMVTTVPEVLRKVGTAIIKVIDTGHQINRANTVATADVILNGAVFLKGLPATTLLELEKRISAIKEVIMVAPTLDPAKGYSTSPELGECWMAKDVVRQRTAKRQVAVVLYPATDHHPAQTQLISEDVPTGTVHVAEWTGRIAPTDKQRLLDRCDELAGAVKQARARANEQVTDAGGAIGTRLVDYLLVK